MNLGDRLLSPSNSRLGRFLRVNCFTFLFAIVGHANAQMDLMDALDLAMENDAGFRAAQFQYEAVSEAKVQARAALLPNIYYEYQQTDTDQDINEAPNAVDDNESQSYKTVTSGLTINQTIFNYEQASETRTKSSCFAASNSASARFGA